MKLTRRQLRRLIKEAVKQYDPESTGKLLTMLSTSVIPVVEQAVELGEVLGYWKQYAATRRPDLEKGETAHVWSLHLAPEVFEHMLRVGRGRNIMIAEQKEGNYKIKVWGTKQF